MTSNGGSVDGLLSYETLVHAVAGAMVRELNTRNTC
ncbi:peroxisomal membrane protein PMP34, partial [Tachysurus ichikawai]